MSVGTITINIDPFIHLGPLTIAWHGLTIAVGVLFGGLVVGRAAREQELDTEPLWTISFLLVAGGLVGGRVFYLAEHGGLGDPSTWLGSRGFTFDGGFIAAALLIAGFVRHRRMSLGYVDAVALGLPLGVAIGRLGDVINGEHYGSATSFFLGVRNAHPDADVPSNLLAYHSGGLYEVLIAASIFAILWPLRRRLLRRPLLATWLVLALFSVGRFFEFFLRSDSPQVALGLSSTQWTSIVMLVIAVAGALVSGAIRPRRSRSGAANATKA